MDVLLDPPRLLAQQFAFDNAAVMDGRQRGGGAVALSPCVVRSPRGAGDLGGWSVRLGLLDRLSIDLPFEVSTCRHRPRHSWSSHLTKEWTRRTRDSAHDAKVGRQLWFTRTGIVTVRTGTGRLSIQAVGGGLVSLRTWKQRSIETPLALQRRGCDGLQFQRKR